MTAAVIVNPAAGRDRAAADRLRELVAASRLNARIFAAQTAADVSTLARKAIHDRCELVVAAGGDGTANAVANEVCGSRSVFGILPLGTLNHFAKDLHIPLDLAGAVRTLLDGVVRQVDVGEVNGRIFLNNSSLGLYAHIVHQRLRRQRHGARKWQAFFRAAYATLRRYPYLHVQVEAGGQPFEIETPLVFVGNNVYVMEGLHAASRQQLNAGQLCLCVLARGTRWALFRLALQALVGRLHAARDLQIVCTQEVWIRTERKRVRVSTDGEVRFLQSPLHYRTLPAALPVMTPAP